jgi:AIR synthase-related protein
MLPELAAHLRDALGVQQKREIQAAARHLPSLARGPWGQAPVKLGDDCAAIPDGEGYLLLAAEGIWPELVAREPAFAAFCSVLVNVSDVCAMGGRPLAVVDALFATDAASAEPLWAGMRAAAERFGVPVVGGHTNLHSPYPALAVAILGRARRLITSFDARPGHDLILAVDLRGSMHGHYPFWNATTDGPADRLRADHELLPALAEAGVVAAGKDVSMGGVIGTAVMLLEASGVGATLSLDALPRPAGIPWESWLLAFPSYGFLLAAAPGQSPRALKAFAARGIDAAVVGRVDETRALKLATGATQATVWDLAHAPLTGFAPEGPR